MGAAKILFMLFFLLLLAGLGYFFVFVFDKNSKYGERKCFFWNSLDGGEPQVITCSASSALKTKNLMRDRIFAAIEYEPNTPYSCIFRKFSRECNGAKVYYRIYGCLGEVLHPATDMGHPYCYGLNREHGSYKCYRSYCNHPKSNSRPGDRLLFSRPSNMAAIRLSGPDLFRLPNGTYSDYIPYRRYLRNGIYIYQDRFSQ